MERALARSRDRLPEPRSTGRRIRLMIVDDSTVARAVLSRMVETEEGPLLLIDVAALVAGVEAKAA